MKALGTVEVQPCSAPLFLLLHGQTNGVQNQIHRLLSPGLVSHNAVVIEARKMDRYSIPVCKSICHPFADGRVCMKIPIQQIPALMSPLYPICCRFLRRWTSDGRPYFFITYSAALGLENIFSQSNIRQQLCAETGVSLLCDDFERTVSLSRLYRQWTKA